MVVFRLHCHPLFLNEFNLFILSGEREREGGGVPWYSYSDQRATCGSGFSSSTLWTHKSPHLMARTFKPWSHCQSFEVLSHFWTGFTYWFCSGARRSSESWFCFATSHRVERPLRLSFLTFRTRRTKHYIEDNILELGVQLSSRTCLPSVSEALEIQSRVSQNKSKENPRVIESLHWGFIRQMSWATCKTVPNVRTWNGYLLYKQRRPEERVGGTSVWILEWEHQPKTLTVKQQMRKQENLTYRKKPFGVFQRLLQHCSCGHEETLEFPG